ncbi:hypothetical protein [Nocardia sp. CC227C]|uniref:hypothetical protein n=1 Tax=Nocardia sp. CC227C TaxID=3044562 RepID=UPI00278BBD7B|nr:hypothetical protein [Nocardia sp. CC227C]
MPLTVESLRTNGGMIQDVYAGSGTPILEMSDDRRESFLGVRVGSDADGTVEPPEYIKYPSPYESKGEG